MQNIGKYENKIVYPASFDEFVIGKYKKDKLKKIKGWYGFQLCFNSQFKHLGEWVAEKASDYKYSTQLLKANPLFQQKIIDKILTGFNHNNKTNSGKKESIIIRDFQEFIQLHHIQQIYISPLL